MIAEKETEETGRMGRLRKQSKDGVKLGKVEGRDSEGREMSRKMANGSRNVEVDEQGLGSLGVVRGTRAEGAERSRIVGYGIDAILRIRRI
jgi:hypothetical protein